MVLDLIKSILNAVEVLDCFSEEYEELGLTDIVSMTGMNKSTAHHLLSTLVKTKLLQKTEQSRYKLGIKIFEMGSLVNSRMEVGRVAKPVLETIVQRFQETVHLAVLEGLDAMYIQKLESNRSIRMFSRVGQRMPLYCTGIGKIFLAHHKHLLPHVLGHGLHKRTMNTITDPELLREELNRIKQYGYSVDREEMEEGLMSVAVPVHNYKGNVIAAISATGPAERIQKLGIDRIAKQMKTASQTVSEEMGYIPGLHRHR